MKLRISNKMDDVQNHVTDEGLRDMQLDEYRQYILNLAELGDAFYMYRYIIIGPRDDPKRYEYTEYLLKHVDKYKNDSYLLDVLADFYENGQFVEQDTLRAIELHKTTGNYMRCSKLSDNPLYWMHKAVFEPTGKFRDGWPEHCIAYINKFKELNKDMNDVLLHEHLRKYYEKYIEFEDKRKGYLCGIKELLDEYNEICDILGGEYANKKKEFVENINQDSNFIFSLNKSFI
jgi:hypothetical protein